jgi:hypothetical protein
MGERYDKSVSKENSEWSLLMGGATTTTNGTEAPEDVEMEDRQDGEKAAEAEKKKEMKRKKKNKKSSETAPVKLDANALQDEDEVQEGVDWSSEEED